MFSSGVGFSSRMRLISELALSPALARMCPSQEKLRTLTMPCRGHAAGAKAVMVRLGYVSIYTI